MAKHEYLRRLLGDDGLVEFAGRIQLRNIAPRQGDSIQMRIALTAYGNWVADKAATPERIQRIQQRIREAIDNEPTHHHTDNT